MRGVFCFSIGQSYNSYVNKKHDRRRFEGAASVYMAHLTISPGEIEEFCRRWQIAELALFGSILTDDFGPDSDIDVLVTSSIWRPCRRNWSNSSGDRST